MAGERDELGGLGDDRAALRCAGDVDAAPAPEFEQALVAQHAQSAQHGVGVDLEHRGEIPRGRQAPAWAGLAVGDRAADLRGDLDVQERRVGVVDLDVQDDVSYSSFIESMSAASLSPPRWTRIPVTLAAAVIERARRRQRRRWARVAVLLLAAIAVAALTYMTTSAGGKAQPANAPHAALVAAGAVFDPARSPYMGVDCPGTANSIACDRVGLALWLRRPAIAVTATIAGRSLTLHGARMNDPTSAAPGPRKAFTGYLHPAGIIDRLHVRPVDGEHWYGDGPAPSPTVTLRISYPGDRVVTTRLHIDLNPGWG